jgi:hypothetical protein
MAGQPLPEWSPSPKWMLMLEMQVLRPKPMRVPTPTQVLR